MAELVDHLSGPCPCCLIRCPKCFATYPKAEADSHNCIEYMKEKRIREVLELLKHNEETGVDYYKTKLKCKKGHELRQFRGFKSNSKCSNCQEDNLNMHKYYYRCEECDYNLC